MRASSVAGALGGAVALAVAACGASTHEVLTPDDAGVSIDGRLPDGAVIGDDGPGPNPGESSRAAYCAGSGPPILVDGAGAACAGGLAQSTFRWAACTCEGFVGTQPVTTDSFDSRGGAYDPSRARRGGSFGTDGPFNTNGAFAIGGAFWVSDPGPLTSTAKLDVAGDLHAEGKMDVAALAVGTDAFVAGDLLAQGDVTIAGTLHQPAGRALSVQGTKKIGAIATEPVSVAPPCDCGPGQLVDVASFVESHRAANDDAAAGVDPRALENVAQDLTLSVPCGRIFFTRIGGDAAIHLVMQAGRAAVFVGGDLSSHGPFTIDVPAGSELDLFVEGNVTSGSTFALGSATNPAKARLYVGGNGSINLVAANTLAGNVYGPRAELLLGGSTAVYGSVFVRRINTQGSLAIHYDEAILSAGEGCPPAPGACTTCHDCGNQACVQGVCGACTDNGQCCAPLLCVSGRCVPELK